MKKLLSIRSLGFIFGIISYFNSYSQSFELKGFIKNREGLSLSFINIEIHNKKLKTSSNKFGAFRIQVEKGDTIHFHSIGYKNQNYVVKYLKTEEPLQIIMDEKSYPLNTFQFKRKNNDSLAKVYANFMKKDSLLNDITRYTKFPKKAAFSIENGLVLRGLITQIWYNNSKKGKEMERLKLLSQLYQEELKAEDKLSTEFIAQVCLVDLETAEEIKKKCKPGAKFVIEANEYELALYVMNCSKNLIKD